MKRECLT